MKKPGLFSRSGSFFISNPPLNDGAGCSLADQTRSKRSAFITLVQAATKSPTNFACMSLWP